MHRRIGSRYPVIALILALLAVTVLAACGTSSGAGGPSAQSLLKQTFSGSHKVDSGVLSFDLNLDPSGSSTIKTPISLSLSGPFQSRGAGKLPESDFSLNINALGHHGALGIISTGANGYVSLDGQAYELPASDFQRLASSFSGASGAGAGAGGLSKLGIDPLHWLTNPSVLGSETVGGAATTHIRAGLNVTALLADLSTFLGKATSSSGTAASGIPTAISQSARAQIAAAVKSATVDVWTGASDKTLRKLSIELKVPISGQISTLLGGMTGAGIRLSFQYADLNQPQTIAAPTSVQPFTGFALKLRSVLSQVQSTFGAGGLGGAAGGGSSSSSGATPSGAAGVGKYTKCIQQSGGNVTNMQKCASLLNGG